MGENIKTAICFVICHMQFLVAKNDYHAIVPYCLLFPFYSRNTLPFGLESLPILLRDAVLSPR